MAAGFFIVVAGCGRSGSHLTNHPSGIGHNVAISDRDPSAGVGGPPHSRQSR